MNSNSARPILNFCFQSWTYLKGIDPRFVTVCDRGNRRGKHLSKIAWHVLWTTPREKIPSIKERINERKATCTCRWESEEANNLLYDIIMEWGVILCRSETWITRENTSTDWRHRDVDMAEDGGSHPDWARGKWKDYTKWWTKMILDSN